MLQYKTGNIFHDEVDAIVNTVNCVGVMGRGLALQFKNRYPKNFTSYSQACKNNEVVIGKMHIFETGTLVQPRYIINFPTKTHWRNKSRLADINAGLDDLVQVIKNRGIRSIAIPPLGCGLGGLDWNVVRTSIEEKLGELNNVNIHIYGIENKPNAAEMVPQPKVPNMTVGRALLLKLMWNYRSALLDPFITLLEIQKLMFFLQVSGEELKLHYVKGHYGPYAQNLRHVLQHIEGYFITGYADGGDDPKKEIEIIDACLPSADEVLQSHPESVKRLERVLSLIEGFESSFGLELLSTVYWVVMEEGAKTFEEIVSFVYSWGKQKEKFDEWQIRQAFNRLKEKNFISL